MRCSRLVSCEIEIRCEIEIPGSGTRQEFRLAHVAESFGDLRYY